MADETPEPVEAELSEEDQKMLGIVQKLITKDKPTQDTCTLLVVAQQIYHAGLQGLRERMTELGIDEAAETHLVNSMRHAAMNPFQLESLTTQVNEIIHPWLLGRAASVNMTLARERQQEQEVVEEKRRDESIPFGYESGTGDTFGRTRPVVFTGSNGVAKRLLNFTVKRQAGSSLNVLHLSLNPIQRMRKKAEKNQRVVEVYIDNWRGIGESYKKLSEVISRHLRLLRDHRVDLLVVDDLYHLAKSNSNSGGSIPRTSVKAIPALRKCMKQFGCAVLAGMMPELLCPDVPDFDSPEWSSLSGNTDLRWVSLKEADEEGFKGVKINGALTNLSVDNNTNIILDEVA